MKYYGCITEKKAFYFPEHTLFSYLQITLHYNIILCLEI